MTRSFLLVLLLLLAPALPAAATPVVADISSYRIAMDAGFTGIRLFLFGARNEPGDIFIVIRGPERTFTVRKKERIGGVWVNSQQMPFKRAPEFYALASTPGSQTNAPYIARMLGIGLENLISSPDRPLEKALFPDFSRAFLRHQQEHKLYNDRIALSFMGETLFKAVIPFSDNLPKGDYTAEIYLFSDGELAGMQAMPIRVEKSGFDAAVYDLAHSYPVLYGLLAIGLALGAGWLANRIFDRS